MAGAKTFHEPTVDRAVRQSAALGKSVDVLLWDCRPLEAALSLNERYHMGTHPQLLQAAVRAPAFTTMMRLLCQRLEFWRATPPRERLEQLAIVFLDGAGRNASRAIARVACEYLVRSPLWRLGGLTNLTPASASPAHCRGCALCAFWSRRYEATLTALDAGVAAFGMATTTVPATDARSPS